ncbi:quinon protein alcohol dehydrogenase-like superfamily [Endogone sp. FLAS-F59071]|nr:quinon protein alcohol dehydrogenase-like superfamily [Endogone sp. FLAS-F59071]|eukprot:RUS22682.1 quinon protein alcohol dehydrogenase-like superfamily [Endogone sp. FLAS-F59071]
MATRVFCCAFLMSLRTYPFSPSPAMSFEPDVRDRRGKSSRHQKVSQPAPSSSAWKEKKLSSKGRLEASQDDNQATESTVCYINRIPIELLTHIFARLEPHVLNTAALVCEYWRHVITDDACWRDAFMAFFGCMPYRRLAVDSWKSEYILRTRLLRKWERGRGMNPPFEPRVGPIDKVHVDFKESWMLAGSLERGLTARCDPATGKIDRDLIFSTEDNTGLEISAMKIDSHRILWGYKAGYVALTVRSKATTARQLKRFSSFHEGPISALAWSTTVHGIIASGGVDGFVKIWDVHTGSCVRDLTGAFDRITALELDPKFRVIAGTAGGAVVIWDLDAAALASSHHRNHRDDVPLGGAAYVATFTSPSRKIVGPAPVEALEYDSESGTFVVSYFEKPNLWKYNAATGACLAVYTGGHTAGVTCIAWDRDPVSVAIAEPNLSIISVNNPPSTTTSSSTQLPGLTVIKTTRLLVTGDSAGTVCLWDGDAGSDGAKDEPLSVPPLRMIGGHLAAISALNMDGFKIISGSEDGWVKAWEPLTGTLIKILHSRAGRVAPGSIDVSRSAVRCIQSSEYQGVVTIGAYVKTWDFSPDKQMLTRRNKKKAKKAVAGSVSSQMHQDIQHEVRESTLEIAYERKTRDRHARELERMTLGLSDQELLDYAIMISRDEGSLGVSPIRAPQNSYVPDAFSLSGCTPSLAVQEEEDLVRAVIASLEIEGSNEHHDEDDDENGNGDGNDDDATSAASESESTSLFSGASSFDSHSFDGRTGVVNRPVETTLGVGHQTLSSASSSHTRGAVLSSRNSKSPVDKEEQDYDGDDNDYESWGDYPSIGSGRSSHTGTKGDAKWQTTGPGVRKTPAAGVVVAQEYLVNDDEELQFVLQLSKDDK